MAYQRPQPDLSTDCHCFLTHEIIRGILKIALEPGQYNKEFRGWASEAFYSFKILPVSIGSNLKNKRGVGNVGDFILIGQKRSRVEISMGNQILTSEIRE